MFQQDSSLPTPQTPPQPQPFTTTPPKPSFTEQQEQNNLKCPRCDSTNTKFCYFNNYNLSQPRYFCKHCRRYWTKGGSLRNIPVGGGTRKNSKRAVAAASATPKRPLPSPKPPLPLPEPPKPSQFDNDHLLLNMGGCSFSSLLGAGIDGGEGMELQSSALMPMPESFVGLHGECWNGVEWTDLTIFSPSSRFR